MLVGSPAATPSLCMGGGRRRAGTGLVLGEETSRVFNGISFREIFAKRKRNEFRNFAKKKIIFAKFRVSRKCNFSENKRNETKRNERNKQNETKRSKA